MPRRVLVLNPDGILPNAETTETTTGTPNQSNLLVPANNARRYLRLIHTDRDNTDISPKYHSGGGASESSPPLIGYGSYWEFVAPTQAVYVFCEEEINIAFEEGW